MTVGVPAEKESEAIKGKMKSKMNKPRVDAAPAQASGLNDQSGKPSLLTLNPTLSSAFLPMLWKGEATRRCEPKFRIPA